MSAATTMESQPINDSIVAGLPVQVGARVWFRLGMFGDGRDRTFWGRVVDGPRRNAHCAADSWLVVGEPAAGCDRAARLFTTGVWMGRVRRAEEQAGGERS